MKLYVSKRGVGGFNERIEDTSIISYVPEARFNEPAQCTITLSDPTGAKLQEYSSLKLTETIDAAINYDASGPTYTDYTTEANSAAAGDVILPGAAITRELGTGDIFYFGWAEQVCGFQISIQTGLDDGNGITSAWEYWNGAWVALSVTDGASDFVTTGTSSIYWTKPADWATTTINSQGPYYYVRYRLTSVVAGPPPAIGAAATQIWHFDNGIGASVELEDPDTTDLFLGRVQKAEGDSDSRTCTLYCEDWLCQLDDTQITYDMREDLDGAGTRASVIYPDIDNVDGFGINPAYNNAGTYYVYDGEVGLTINAHNGQYLIFTDEMAGSIEMWTGPYDETISIAPDVTNAPAAGEVNVWDDDGTVKEVEDANNSFYIQYEFRVWLDSAFVTSIDQVWIDYAICDEDDNVEVQVYNGTISQTIGTVPQSAAADSFIRGSFRCPDSIISTMFDANGTTHMRFVHGAAGGNLKIDMVRMRCKATTTGYSTASLISDGETYRLTVPTDFSADAQKVWSQLPYCIAKPIYLHIESATGPVLGYDTVYTLTCGVGNVENTSGISTRQYVDKTPLEILQDLARQDKAECWIALGGSTVTYKSTWNAAGTAMTDAKVISLRSVADLTNLFNKTTVYGMRIGDRQLSSSYTDTTSTTSYGLTRTKVERGTGLVSEYDTLARATAITNMHKDLKLMLTAQIPGLDSTYRLGTEVSLTSTYLGLTAAMYIVDSWKYDSESHLTTITMHPRVSQVGLISPDFTNRGLQQYRKGITEKYIAPPESDIV